MKNEIPYSKSLEELFQNTATYAASVNALAQNTGHVCIAMCSTPSCEGYRLLDGLDINPRDMLERIYVLQKSPALTTKLQRNKVSQSKSIMQAIRMARVVAMSEGSHEINTGHVLAGILKAGNSIASQALSEFNVTESRMLKVMRISQLPVMA